VAVASSAKQEIRVRFGRDDKGREGNIQMEGEKLAGCVKMGDLIGVHFFADLQQ
jgi:hypothetical protein